jgi:GTPase SAR1 family protein
MNNTASRFTQSPSQTLLHGFTLNEGLINTMIMGFMMTGISTLTAIIAKFVTYLFTKISELLGKLWKKIKYHIPYFRKYTIYITYDKHDIVQGENNKLLIDSILYDFKHGDYYKMSNKGVAKDEPTELSREKNRSMILSVLDEFVEDDITIRYNKAEKSVPVANSSNVNSAPQQPAPQTYPVENIYLDSYKSIEHIEKYVERKRDNYINKFCVNDKKIYIYTGNVYGYSFVEFQKIVFESNKTFKTWFCSEKQKMLEIIDNFSNKKGSYSLSSNVYKLGILLHGKPGCGKTSFIKALAKEMNRNIVTISLDKFTSCSCFMKLFHSEYLLSPNTQNNMMQYEYVPMSKRILVFEDIDTAGDIVKKRNDVIIKNDENDNKESNNDDKKDAKKTIEVVTKKDKNELVLGDILNVLDGICETTGLVYVMTTNHIDVLDPALIRPGRITCSIELKEMNKQELKEMLTYYYTENSVYDEKLSHDEKMLLINKIATFLDGKCTPSIIENYCNKYDLINFRDNMDKLVA